MQVLRLLLMLLLLPFMVFIVPYCWFFDAETPREQYEDICWYIKYGRD